MENQSCRDKSLQRGWDMSFSPGKPPINAGPCPPARPASSSKAQREEWEIRPTPRDHRHGGGGASQKQAGPQESFSIFPGLNHRK